MGVVFTDNEITDFCECTQDTNNIHKPAFMAERGKQAIVPGMLTLAYAAHVARPFLSSIANKINVSFGGILNSGEGVDFTAHRVRDLEIRLIAQRNGTDLLATKDAHSGLQYVETQSYVPIQQGVLRNLEVNPDQLNMFARLLNAQDSPALRFLFAVAYSSQALLQGTNTPQGAAEEELSKHVNDKGILPVYRSLEVGMLDYIPELDPARPLEYTIQLSVKGRNYEFRTECAQANNLLYFSTMKLKGVSEKAVIGMAKSAENPG